MFSIHGRRLEYVMFVWYYWLAGNNTNKKTSDIPDMCVLTKLTIGCSIINVSTDMSAFRYFIIRSYENIVVHPFWILKLAWLKLFGLVVCHLSFLFFSILRQQNRIEIEFLECAWTSSLNDTNITCFKNFPNLYTYDIMIHFEFFD